MPSFRSLRRRSSLKPRRFVRRRQWFRWWRWRVFDRVQSLAQLLVAVAALMLGLYVFREQNEAGRKQQRALDESTDALHGLSGVAERQRKLLDGSLGLQRRQYEEVEKERGRRPRIDILVSIKENPWNPATKRFIVYHEGRIPLFVALVFINRGDGELRRPAISVHASPDTIHLDGAPPLSRNQDLRQWQFEGSWQPEAWGAWPMSQDVYFREAGAYVTNFSLEVTVMGHGVDPTTRTIDFEIQRLEWPFKRPPRPSG